MAQGDSIGRRTLLIYALPAFALAMPTIPAYVYLPTFYAETLGLGLAAVGAVLLVARSLDVLTDPLIGIASDRLPSRWGRRKPWIVAGALLAAVALIQLFQPPADVGAVHLLVWSIALYFGWTLIAVPYAAWGAELSPDYHERARITGVREAVMVLGVVAAGGLPSLIAYLGYGETTGLAAVAWLAIAVGAPAILLLVWLVRDSAGHGEAAAGMRTPLRLNRQSLAPLLANRPFVRLLAGWFVNGLANGLPSVLFPLYLQHALGAGTAASGVLIMAYFISGVAAIPGWLALSRRFGKHRVWCWAMIMACLAFVWVPFLEPGRDRRLLRHLRRHRHGPRRRPGAAAGDAGGRHRPRHLADREERAGLFFAAVEHEHKARARARRRPGLPGVGCAGLRRRRGQRSPDDPMARRDLLLGADRTQTVCNRHDLEPPHVGQTP